MSMGWGREACIQALKDCAEEIGHEPTFDEFDRWQDGVRPGRTAIRNEFGSWNAAKEAAGMDTIPEGGRR